MTNMAKLNNPDYRRAFARESVKTWIAYQIRALREQRRWMPRTLAMEIGKPQSVISRIENPDYGRLTLRTLFEVAEAFDVALLVRFVDHETMLQEYSKAGPDDMRVASFADIPGSIDDPR